MVTPCTARGLPRGDAIPVRVEFLPPDEHARIDRLMVEKCHFDRLLILPNYRLVMKLRGKAIDERGGAYLAITSTGAPRGRRAAATTCAPPGALECSDPHSR